MTETTIKKKSLNLTKLDVFDQLDEIKIGVAYTLNGKKLESFPGNKNFNFFLIFFSFLF